MDEQLRRFERYPCEPGDLAGLRRFADARRRAGLDLLPAIVRPVVWGAVVFTAPASGVYFVSVGLSRRSVELKAGESTAFLAFAGGYVEVALLQDSHRIASDETTATPFELLPG